MQWIITQTALVEDGLRSVFCWCLIEMKQPIELQDEARGVVQLAECLRSMRKALSLSPSSAYS